MMIWPLFWIGIGGICASFILRMCMLHSVSDQIKIVQIYPLFETKTAQKPYPLEPHITLTCDHDFFSGGKRVTCSAGFILTREVWEESSFSQSSSLLRSLLTHSSPLRVFVSMMAAVTRERRIMQRSHPTNYECNAG